MPLLSTRGAASARGFGLFSTIPILYWIGTLGGSGTDLGRSVAVDSSGNVYFCGRSNSNTPIGVQLAKYSASGVLQWQRKLSGTSNDEGYGVAVDSSGNVYVCGITTFSFTQKFLIAKYNTSGTLQWQRRLGSASQDPIAYSVAIDSSGNVYVAGDISGGASARDVLFAKYNTSGTIQWQRTLWSNANDYCLSVAVDSSANVYICGYTAVSGNNDILIAKYNTSGTIQWQRRLGRASAGSTTVGYGVAVDSSGNVYVCGYSDAVGSSAQVAKYNTSGTIQWQRRLGTASSTTGNSVAVDSFGNVYVGGSATGVSPDISNILIAKYNTSGTIQWQRTLSSSLQESASSIAVDSSGNVYVCGTSNNTDFVFAKVPGDGTKTGTYTVGSTSYTYAASSLTEAASSLTDAATTLTSDPAALTDATPSLTDAASSLTSSVTII